MRPTRGPSTFRSFSPAYRKPKANRRKNTGTLKGPRENKTWGLSGGASKRNAGVEERHGGQGLYDISHSLQTEVDLIPVGAKRLPSGGVEILFVKVLLFSRQHQRLHPRLHHTKKARFCPFTIDKP